MKKGCSVLLALMVLGPLFGLLATGVLSFVIPKQYESEAVVEVKLRPLAGDSSLSAAIPMSSRSFAAEFEKIKSVESLGKVVEPLSLASRWNVETKEAIRILRGMITIQNIHKRGLISIRVRHANKEDARDIAVALLASYRDYRNEVETKREEAVLAALDQAIRDQGDRVDQRNAALAGIVRAKGNSIRQRRVGLDNCNDPSEAYRNAARGFETAHERLYQMKLNKVSGEVGMRVVTGEDMVSTGKAIQEQEVKVEDALRLFAAIYKTEGIEYNGSGWLWGRSVFGDELFTKGLSSGLDMCDYMRAKLDLEVEQEILNQWKLKRIVTEVGGNDPSRSMEVHEFPQLADAPVAPNVTLNLVLGTLAGAIVFPLAGLLVMGVMRIARGNARAGER